MLPDLFVVGRAAEVVANLAGAAVLTAPADRGAVCSTVAAAGRSRWLLVVDAAETAPVEAFVADVLDGSAPVFGLAGVVVLDISAPAGTVRREPGSLPPRLVVRPDEAGAALLRWWADDVGRGPQVPADYAAVLASTRVTSRVRAINARRALPDDPGYLPRALLGAALATLRVLADVVVPQPGADQLDLAARVDALLADGAGDGWRFADLPPDGDAYRAALAELADLVHLDEAARHAAVTAVAAGERVTRGELSAGQLAHWLQDAVVDLVRQWLAHPANLARTGFDGVATGGDGELLGFSLLGAGEQEPWEPAMERRPTA